MAYLCTSRAGWLAAADCFRMAKSLALKATQRIWDVWSNWAMDVGHFNGLWEVRRRKEVVLGYSSTGSGCDPPVHQGTPNCNTNPKATVFGIPKEPVLETAELITSRLTGAGSLLPPVYGEAWAKGHATGTPDSTFPRYGSPHTANMRVRLKNQS
ncbi:hypothetical protein TNCV_3196691 [Trichonephila clavipes]|nr:hypothetical protein TNCV_3196691 [Trichonephila clavipes]